MNQNGLWANKNGAWVITNGAWANANISFCFMSIFCRVFAGCFLSLFAYLLALLKGQLLSVSNGKGGEGKWV